MPIEFINYKDRELKTLSIRKETFDTIESLAGFLSQHQLDGEDIKDILLYIVDEAVLDYIAVHIRETLRI